MLRLLTALVATYAAAQTAGMRAAIDDMQRGDFAAAERKLRSEAAARPSDAQALSLLAAALDNQHRIEEAAPLHARAVGLAPRAIDVLVSYAAHLSMAGDSEAARNQYLRVLAIDSTQYVANLQLARLSLQHQLPGDALKYLQHLPVKLRDNPQPLLLRMSASYQAGDRSAGDQAFARVQELAKSDLSLSFAGVNALSAIGRYDQAQALCESALRAFPANFNVLYDLGVTAISAGHFDRAREVLEIALAQHPQDVDVLLALARAEEAARHTEAAARLLARAAKINPRRSDVQELLALTATELGALEDAAAAWDRYLELEPSSDTGRRERSYVMAQMGSLEAGVAGLEDFVAHHPDDALGHYELGQAERAIDSTRALREFERALALDPNHAPSRIARGSLYYQEGKPELAVKDLEVAASLRLDDPAALDSLGQVYQSLDRSADALRVLARAVDLAPRDSKILLHYARALADAGRMEESKRAMDRFRELGPTEQRQLPRGFVAYLSLTDAQRLADYRMRVERQVRDHPDDATAQLAWLKLLLQEGDRGQAAATARRIAAIMPELPVLADTGRTLSAFGQYDLAREVLQTRAAGSADLQLDLAVTTFYCGDVAESLRAMARIPEAARSGDYHLAHAQMLAASGASRESRAALERAFAAAPPRLDFYRHAVAFLIDSDQAPLALRFLDRGAELLPRQREVLLLKAVALEFTGKTAYASHQLDDIRATWPEWYPAWIADGVIAQRHNRPEDARQAFRTGAALGAPADLEKIDLKDILEGALFR